MKKAPKLLDDMMREAKDVHEGDSWKRGADESNDDDEPPSPPKRRRHPEDEPEQP